jgi:cytochrome bd-type quinol oxidase subunit 2
MERYLSYVRKFLSSFTAIFTCIILASAVFIGIYSNPYLPFRLIVQSLILAALSALLNFIYYSDKPIHKRAMAVRTGIHFGALLTLVLFCAWKFEWFSFSHANSVLTFLLLFLTVYFIVWLASFTGDLIDERKINKRLMELNSSPMDKGTME